MNRGDARLRRGYSVETSRGDAAPAGNMQARFLTTHTESGKVITARNDTVPSLAAASENLDSLGVVGLVEHYEASMCLLLFRSMGGSLPRDGPCSCKAFRTNKLEHNAHGVPGHSVESLNASTRALVDKLVQVDRRLYEYARRVFYGEVNRVLNATGVDLLCRASASARRLAPEDAHPKLGTVPGARGTRTAFHYIHISKTAASSVKIKVPVARAQSCGPGSIN